MSVNCVCPANVPEPLGIKQIIIYLSIIKIIISSIYLSIVKMDCLIAN